MNRYKILVIWVILAIFFSCKAEIQKEVKPVATEKQESISPILDTSQAKVKEEEKPAPTKKSEPISFISTTSQIEPLKKILQKKYKDDFWAGTAGGNDNRIMWYYETKVYSGFISFDIIPTQQEKIVTSTLNFQIYPDIKGKKFKKAWQEAEDIISKWAVYFSGDALESEDILPLYYSTLEQAQKNYKKMGMSFRFNTFNVRSFEVKISCDIVGILTLDLKRI